MRVTFGNKGVQTISYAGTLLEDVGVYGNDSFHIWHMKSTDLHGNVINTGQYGWGESNNGQSWDASSQTETYFFSWGKIATQFVQHGDNLDMIVTETNYPGSGIVFDGAEIDPFALHFPQDPTGFYGYTQYAITTIQPGVSAAEFGSGRVTSVIPDESIAMYGGWKNQGGNTYSPIMSATYPDGIATFLPHNDKPLQPGSTLTYSVSLRFTPAGRDADAGDAYASFAATYPSQMTWTDKRILGTAWVASSPSGDIHHPGGFPTNPRRFFNDPSIDVTTASGLQSFQNRMLQQAASNARNARLMNAQGVITWDIEGEEYPQSTSYVCSPDQVASLAPEMESAISDRSSAYYGHKLDDAYFRTMSDAGLKVGLCLRPQVFTKYPDGTASQNFLSDNAAIVANLENKARIANARWGATIFYVDSTVDQNGGTLDPAIFQQIITDLPNFLFIPEESTPRYYAYTAPFYTFLFHGDLGTADTIYKFYPRAFGANLINDVSADRLSNALGPLTASVARGDILMGHADYWQDNDPTLVSIYAAAGVGNLPPVQVTPSITWNIPAPISYGTAISATQLNAFANVTGTFVYTPAAGTVPPAGSTTLLASFTPADTVHYTSATAATTLVVNQVAPVINWPSPAPVPAGSVLSGQQLNATANIAGTFTYVPAAGSVLSSGVTTLQVTFTPADTTNYSVATATTTLTVTAAAPGQGSLTWNNPAAITYGTRLSSAQLNAAAGVPGRYSYSPVIGTLLHTGDNTLTVTFFPADPVHYARATASVSITVLQATPSLHWPAPYSIAAGTALSSIQLNASSRVAGRFTYDPAPGTVLPAGTAVLSATFTPVDTDDYVAETVTTQLVVRAGKSTTPAAPVTNPAPIVPSGPLAILWPSPQTTVSGQIAVSGLCTLALDAAGSFLMVDGQEVGTGRVGGPPFLYGLDTTTLTNGPHVLQLWSHDIGNNTTLSSPVTINVVN